MNKEIMQQLGFANEVALVENGQCPFCLKYVVSALESFKDLNSFKEFKISGLCQECQDSMFDDDTLYCSECKTQPFLLAIVTSDGEDQLLLCKDCFEKALQRNKKLIQQFYELFYNSTLILEKITENSWQANLYDSALELVKKVHAETLYLLIYTIVTDEKESVLPAVGYCQQ